MNSKRSSEKSFRLRLILITLMLVKCHTSEWALRSTHVSVSIYLELGRAITCPSQGQIDAHDVQRGVPVPVPYQSRSRGRPTAVATLQSPDVVASDEELMQET